MKGWRQWPLLPIWVWLAALLLCAVLISRATFTADLSAFLPHAPTQQQQLLVDQLRDGVASRLILVGIQGADGPSRAGLSKAVAARLRADGRFTTVSNGQAVMQERDRAFLFNHRYQLSPAMAPEHFSVAGLRAAVGDTLDLLASPAGLLVKSIVPRDPTGEFAGLLEQFAGPAAAGAQRPHKADGVWVSPDGQRALLLLQTRSLGADTDGQQQAMAAVRAAFISAQQHSAPPALSATLVMTGPGVFAVNAREVIKSEVTRLAALSLTLIVTLLLLVYRSLRTLALGLLPVLSGALAGVAAVSLGFGTVHGITLGFGTTLIGEAVDYSIYLFVQSEQTQASSRQWLRDFWPTIRLGVLTSVFGFASLLLSGFPGLAQLGLYSI
ncbi:MAG: MMPL family transporter, partial [Rhodoferax sp.]